MDVHTLLKLLRTLLNADVYLVEENPDTFKTFEDKHCYDRSIQPIFAANALVHLTNHMKDYVFYEIIDKLDIHMIFFRFQDHLFLIGPFVTHYFDENKLQMFLTKNGYPISHFTPIRLLYTNYPLLHSSDIYHVLLSCLQVMDENCPTFSYRTLYGFETPETSDEDQIRQSIDYSEIYKRYENENALLNAIEDGDMEHVELYFDRMRNVPQELLMSYYNSVAYHSPSSVLRGLVRKAAERGGVSVVVLDELTQEQVQLEQENHMKGVPDNSVDILVMKLTKAVAEHKKSTAGCSPAVVSVIDFIYLNYSQAVTMEQIASVSGYSVSHISKLFREETGMPVMDYIAKLRCEKAASLLKSTDLSIGEIGALVGYSDNNYFTKKFKQFVGATPRNYREGVENTKRF